MKSSIDKTRGGERVLERRLKPFSVWALSFGCAVGWGAFVMPGNTFLPAAGPLGAAIGIALGAAVMMVIACNYCYLMRRHPGAGGAYDYVRKICNHDHAILCAWFLVLAYMAIVWANATALALMSHRVFGGIFRFGAHYMVAGYHVYIGEVAISVLALLVVGAVLCAGSRATTRLQNLLAVILGGGIVTSFAIVFWRAGVTPSSLAPAFKPGHSHIMQIFGVIALAPWAFIGFESVSHSVEEFRFPRRKTAGIIFAALFSSMAAYILLTFLAAAMRPAGFSSWVDYSAAAGDLEGIAGLPAFFAMESTLGKAGLALLCATAFCGVATGLVGNIFATSRLLYAMSCDGILPRALSRLDRDNSPRNATLFLVGVSCLVPLVGRTAIGWLVDVTTIGACIAYGYVSWCAFATARNESNRTYMATGVAGLAAAGAFIVYFLVPNFWTVNAFATESYLALAAWSIFGFLFFRYIFRHDNKDRFGKSSVLWLALLFLIFFASHMWVRQATYSVTEKAISRVDKFYASKYPCVTKAAAEGTNADDSTFLNESKLVIDRALTRYNLVQMSLVVLTLGIMLSVYTTMSRREKEAAKAKSFFFSTVSHDIRTPLNAIIGFSQMLKRGFATEEERKEAIEAILVSSNTLLGLINDILDLSKLDAGKMAINLEPTDCGQIVAEVVKMFREGKSKPGLEIRGVIDKMPPLAFDPLRLRQIVFNLVSNAVKFTSSGHVEARASFVARSSSHSIGNFILEVEDTGVGISEEDQQRIASPYVQLASKLSRHGGTGLGLSICKRLAQEMGGEFSLVSKLGVGSTFRVEIPVEIALAPAATPAASAAPSPLIKEVHTEESAPATPAASAAPFPLIKEVHTKESAPATPAPAAPAAVAPVVPAPADAKRIMLVDDSKMNLTVLKAMLKRFGSFAIETASDGQEAINRLSDPAKAPFDLVLTDMWMPNLDGEGLVKAIREDKHLALLAVYVVTADVELQKNFAEKGFTGIILKPVTFETLKPVMEKMQ